MNRLVKHIALTIFFSFALVLPPPAIATPHEEGARRLTTPLGGVAFEVVGQVSNLSPTVSKQYGYLSFINGLSADQIFTGAHPTLQNETSALFTFFTDAVTERVISNGRLRIVNRVGTTTIYIYDTPDGTFANRDSFCEWYSGHDSQLPAAGHPQYSGGDFHCYESLNRCFTPVF